MNFDVIVIGSGPGGAACAKRLASGGKKVALVGKELGGECLNYGCIPTKTLLWTAELLEKLREGGSTLGIETGDIKINWAQMQKRRTDVISKLKKQLAFSTQKSGVTVIEGTATFINTTIVEVTSTTNEKQTLTAEKIVIATGSSPRTLPGFEWSEKNLSNHQLLELPTLPSSLLIIGGGVIGVEFASLFSALGVSVTIAEAGTQLLPQADPDVAAELERIFIRKKITVLKNTKITPADAEKFDKVLVSVGRAPNVESLNLSNAGITPSAHGIEINDMCQTSVPNIYAIGDVTAGKWNLAYTAEKEGHIAADHIVGKSPAALSKYAVPVTIFSLPEIAWVSSHSAASTTNIKTPYSANAKALIVSGRDGFAKVLVEQDTKKISAVHLIGERACELIAEASLAIAHNMTVDEFSLSLHSHPVLSEVLKEAIEQAE